MTTGLFVQGIILLVVWGTAAALSILMWNKTRVPAVLAVITGVALEFISQAYSLFEQMGVSIGTPASVGGIDFLSLFLQVTPAVSFIVALLIMLRDS